MCLDHAGFEPLLDFWTPSSVCEVTTQPLLPNPDVLVRFWPNASGPETSQRARNLEPGSGRMQSACYQFPTFRLDCVLPQIWPGSYCAKPAQIWFGSVWLCQVLATRIRSKSKNHRAHFWPILLSQSGSNPACLLGYGMTTEELSKAATGRLSKHRWWCTLCAW